MVFSAARTLAALVMLLLTTGVARSSPAFVPAFGTGYVSGTLVAPTGAGLRELSAPNAMRASVSFVVPCATTRLAADQFGFVYLGALTPIRYAGLRLTEFGVQLNPPVGGGRPSSAQIYSRRETRRLRMAPVETPHVGCDKRVNIKLGPIGPLSLAATFSGEAMPHGRAVRLIERLERGEALGATCARCRVERVVSLAVRAGRRPLRAGTQLAVGDDGLPALEFSRDPVFAALAPRVAPPALATRNAFSVRVGIREAAQ